jgi:hypothetical protein
VPRHPYTEGESLFTLVVRSGVRSTADAWVTRAVETLPVRGRQGPVVSWNGTLTLPEALPPGRPGASEVWRVTVEEWELLPADGPTLHEPSREGRLVYADHLPL